jgi:hypothetical protein
MTRAKHNLKRITLATVVGLGYSLSAPASNLRPFRKPWTRSKVERGEADRYSHIQRQ